jgi:hypothetical protein
MCTHECVFFPAIFCCSREEVEQALRVSRNSAELLQVGAGSRRESNTQLAAPVLAHAKQPPKRQLMLPALLHGCGCAAMGASQ